MITVWCNQQNSTMQETLLGKYPDFFDKYCMGEKEEQGNYRFLREIATNLKCMSVIRILTILFFRCDNVTIFLSIHLLETHTDTIYRHLI